MKFNHIIEHTPPGTIYNLISQLSKKYGNHKIHFINSSNKVNVIFDILKNNHFEIFVLHCTGRNLPIFSKIEKIITNVNRKNIYIYMHVSYDYLVYKKRYNAINKLKLLCKNGVLIISPSLEVSNQYNKHGIKSIVIEPGITKFYAEDRNNLSKYYNRIITTCTSDTLEYKKIKGIDKFYKLINDLSLEDRALIAGCNLQDSKIESIKLNHDDFLNVLMHSIVYIQLSKYDSYNITAVEAKQFKIPIILSNIEGHIESADQGYLVNNVVEAKNILQEIIDGDFDKSIVQMNYSNSIINESVESFYERFKILEKNENSIFS